MAAAAEAESRPREEYLLPKHKGPWTLDDVLALPEGSQTGQRIELVDGGLFVSPMGASPHQVLAGDIFAQLRSSTPPDMKATIELNVALSTGRLLIPDFTVVRRSGLGGVTVDADAVVLVGEVISPSSRVQDRVLKSRLYCDAEIPFYLIVDPSGAVPSATLFELIEDEYKEIARGKNGRIEIERPFRVTLELTD